MATALPSTAAWAQTMLLPTAQLSIGSHKIQAEVAATDASRANGLMNRASLPENHGMLFVFDGPTTTCFWMKNTPLPRSAEHTSELQSLMRTSYAVFCLTKKNDSLTALVN